MALLVLPFLIAGYVALNMWQNHHVPDLQSSFGFFGDLLNQSTVLSQILAGSIVLANAILLNVLFNRNDFMESNSFVPGLLYVSLLSFFHSFYYLDGFGVAQFFLVLGLVQMLKLNQNEDARRIVFNASFLIGIACTFSPIMLSIIPFLFWMVWVTRPFIFRESILTVIGFSIPLVYAGVYSSVYGIQLKGGKLSSTSPELWLEDLIVLGGVVFIMLILAARTIALKNCNKAPFD